MSFVTVIIPAYNEEKTIAQVVAVVNKNSLIKEVIVIDDGSEDETANRALQPGVRVIRLPQNQGKGEALKIGVERAKGDILLFLDADLMDLKQKHLQILIKPIIEGSLDMTVGLIDRGKFLNRWLKKFESPISGSRVIKRDFWEKVSDDFKKGYFIETALSYFAEKQGLRTQNFILRDVKHILKEQKHGFLLGFCHRLKMAGELVLVNFLLRI